MNRGKFPMHLARDYNKRLSAIARLVERDFRNNWERVKTLILNSQEGVLNDSAIRTDSEIESIKDNFRTDDGLFLREMYLDHLKNLMDSKSQDQLNNLLEDLEESSINAVNTKDIRKIARSHLKNVGQFATNQVDNQIKSIAGVNPATRPNISDAIDNVLSENVRLIKTIPSKYHSEVQRVIREGVIKGQGLDEIEKAVNKAGNKLSNNARLIARDQTGNAQYAVTRARFEETGLKKFEWASVGDSRVRDRHQKFDGNIYTWKKGANGGVYPGTEIQCRCIAYPVESEVKKNWGMEDPIAPTPTETTGFDPATDSWKNNWDDNFDDAVIEASKATDMNPQEYKEMLNSKAKELVEDASVRIRVPQDTLGKILDDEKFKTQFETKTSGGALAPNIRGDFESSVFGIDAEQVKDRPIYGYLMDRGEYVDEDILNSYGKVTVKLKDSVKDRTTFTLGDSLDTNASGTATRTVRQPIKNPTYRAGRFRGANDFRGILEPDNIKEFTNMRYIEAQVHNGVSIDDIDELRFQTEPSGYLKQKLEDAGVDWEPVDPTDT